MRYEVFNIHRPPTADEIRERVKKRIDDVLTDFIQYNKGYVDYLDQLKEDYQCINDDGSVNTTAFTLMALSDLEYIINHSEEERKQLYNLIESATDKITKLQKIYPSVVQSYDYYIPNIQTKYGLVCRIKGLATPVYNKRKRKQDREDRKLFSMPSNYPKSYTGSLYYGTSLDLEDFINDPKGRILRGEKV